MITKNKIIVGLGGVCIILLTILILVLIFKKKVHPVVPVILSNPTTSYLSNQHIDTVYVDHYIDPKPSAPLLVDTTKPVVPIIATGDTVYIVLDYFTGKTYVYNYKDSVLDFTANIYINKNKVFTIDPKYKYKEKIITVTNNIVSIPNWSIDIGGGLSYGQLEADINIALGINRRRHSFDLYYGILRKEVGITYKYIILYK